MWLFVIISNPLAKNLCYFGIPGLEIGIGIKKTNPGGKIDQDPGIVSPRWISVFIELIGAIVGALEEPKEIQLLMQIPHLISFTLV